MKKYSTYLGIGIAIVIFIVGLLWYYQQQGLLKIFPTSEDRRVNQLLTVDESKFERAQGMTDEQYSGAVAELKTRVQKARDNPKDSQAWFLVGYQKEYLNDHQGAVGAWEYSWELNPLNFVVSNNLGNIFQYFLKDYAKSEHYYKETLKLQPGYTAAYQGLMDLYRYNWKEHIDRYEPIVLEGLERDTVNAVAYETALVEFALQNKDIPKAKSYLADLQKIDAKAASQLVKDYPQLSN